MMTDPFLEILVSISAVSLLSLVGIVTFLNKKYTASFLKTLVSFAAGTMAGAGFLVMLPEALEVGASKSVFLFLLLGVVVFFILENFLQWYHCHKGNCKAHKFTYLSIIGDGLHNFLDGMVIAASYLINVPLGVVTTFAVIFHEIPHEMGNFGVLVYGGFSRKKALFYNFISGLTAIAGGIFVYLFKFDIFNYYALLVAFAAGNFIYIATVDLMPELHKEEVIRKSALQLTLFLFGVFIIWFLSTYVGKG